tara:strand:- start:903 stop:1142 length:240 start_codon:yes stop_codon:yes gene_type:complete
MTSSTSQLKDDYLQLMRETISSIDALMYEIEKNTLQNKSLRKVALDMATDSVPLLRSLKEAKVQAEISLTVFSQKQQLS